MPGLLWPSPLCHVPPGPVPPWLVPPDVPPHAVRPPYAVRPHAAPPGPAPLVHALPARPLLSPVLRARAPPARHANVFRDRGARDPARRGRLARGRPDLAARDDGSTPELHLLERWTDHSSHPRADLVQSASETA